MGRWVMWSMGQMGHFCMGRVGHGSVYVDPRATTHHYFMNPASHSKIWTDVHSKINSVLTEVILQHKVYFVPVGNYVAQIVRAKCHQALSPQAQIYIILFRIEQYCLLIMFIYMGYASCIMGHDVPSHALGELVGSRRTLLHMSSPISLYVCMGHWVPLFALLC